MTRDRVFGITLLAALAAHACVKLHAGGEALAEMLWTCHVATALMAAGFLARRHALVAAAFVFHAGMGLGGWLLELATNGSTPTSAIAHVLPLVFGAIAVREQGVPAGSAAAAWILWVALQPISRVLTPASLNVNLVWTVWPPVASWFRAQPVYVLFNALLAIPFLGGAEWLARRVLVPRTAAPLAPPS